MGRLKTINPTTGETIRTFAEMKTQEISQIVADVEEAQKRFVKTSFSERARLMENVSKILSQKKKDLAYLMMEEMGKPIKQSLSEVEKCAWVCEYYAQSAQEFLSDEIINTDARKSYVCFQPLGVILAIMPWNFPFWQVFRFLAPNLMAGNAGLLKHAANVSGCSLVIESIIQEAGFPENVFRSLLLHSKHVDQVIEHPAVRAVTLTGSTPAGKAVAAKAGQCLKKTVLELGGSDPYIILEDANLKKAAKACVTSRMINGGQSCIAAKRFIVVASVKEKFENYVLEEMKGKTCGDPIKESIDLGPMARQDLRDDIHQQVQKSIEQGARLVLGGKIPPGKGAFYPATVLTDIDQGMTAFQEEIFGPVASIISAKDEEEAIALANQSNFGLGAAVFSENLERAEHIAARRLEAGNCFVNTFVKSDPRLPFGGIKDSGYGRELSRQGVREFVNAKTVYIE